MYDVIECTTQAEVDAVKPGDIAVVRKGRFTAYGSATVTASGSATVTAYDSATVTAYDSATVRAYDSATVSASGSATVTASGSATVTASGSATVTASGSATVRAYDSATVRAYGSATVTATPYVAVHQHSTYTKINGGVLITPPDTETCDAATWLSYYGREVAADGTAILYKAVNDAYQTGRGPEWTYTPGNTVTADDFDPERECGHGLHLCAAPHLSARYLTDATRYVAVQVTADAIIPLGDKVKVRSCLVLHEVDVHGEQLDPSAVSA